MSVGSRQIQQQHVFMGSSDQQNTLVVHLRYRLPGPIMFFNPEMDQMY